VALIRGSNCFSCGNDSGIVRPFWPAGRASTRSSQAFRSALSLSGRSWRERGDRAQPNPTKKGYIRDGVFAEHAQRRAGRPRSFGLGIRGRSERGRRCRGSIQVGDRVFGTGDMTRDGCWAESVALDHSRHGPIISFTLLRAPS
jgi:hypothetical protein